MDPSAPLINWPNIRELAATCAYVYSGPKLLSAPGQQWAMDPHTDAHALIQDLGNCVVVCFRGSKDPKDYLQDAKFEMTELAYTDGNLPVRVHKGFLEDFDALNADLIAAVKNVLQSRQWQKDIFITGHSLGGGLAILCALEFARQKFTIHSVVTFGQPRVGNKSFCEIYNKSVKCGTVRVVNANDIVPRVPPLLNGYRHTGQLAFLLPQGGWKYNPSLITRAIADEIGFKLGFELKQDVLLADHHIGNYQKAIQLL